MDFLSLPDEMLTIVCKYLNPAVLVSVRKKNSRTNRIAERAGLCERLAIEDIKIGSVGITITIDLNLANSYGLEQNEFFSSILKGVKTLDLIFSRIEVTDELVYSDNQYVTYSQIFEPLKRHKYSFRNCTKLRFHCGHESYIWNQHLTESLPNCSKLEFTLSRDGGRPGPLNCEVTAPHRFRSSRDTLQLHKKFPSSISRISKTLKNRKLDYLIIDSTEVFHDVPGLDDNFLHQIVPNCEEFTLYSRNGLSYFSLDGILKLLESTLANIPARAHWILGPVELGDDVPLEEAVLKLQLMHGVLLTVGDIGRWFNWNVGREIKVQFGRNVRIEFTLFQYVGQEAYEIIVIGDQ